MTIGNETQITPPRVPIIDARTNAVSREWYRWFYSLYNILGTGAGIIPVTSGGTGLGTIPTNGQLLIGNGTGYSLNTLGTGVGISVTNGLGTITVANTGVLTNIAGTGISVSGATGNVTISNTGVLSWSGGTTGLTPATATTGAVTLAGTLAIANGGTNGAATPTAYGVAYGTGTAYAFTAAGTAKQVLIANTSAAPTWSTLTSGTSILYGDGSGGFSNVTIGSGVSFVAGTLSATGSGGTVTAVTGSGNIASSGGTTPNITFTGTLPIANGGTNGAATPTAGAVAYGTGTAYGFTAAGTAGQVLTSAGAGVPTWTTNAGGGAPVTKTANFTVAASENWLINNKSGSTCTVTLPTASSWTGRQLVFKNMQAQTLVSASSNVVPIDSTSAGTAILLGVVGNWATMVSDGTNWIIMQAASNNNLLLE